MLKLITTSVLHVMRQWLVVASPVLAALSSGGTLAYPTILIEQFRNDYFTLMNLDTVSWIGSIHGLPGIPSVFMPYLMQWKGRKVAIIITSIIIIIGWLLAYFSTNLATVLLGESFHGLGTSNLLVISQISVSKMAPKFRNIVILVYGISQSLGMIVTGILAQHIHWKIILKNITLLLSLSGKKAYYSRVQAQLRWLVAGAPMLSAISSGGALVYPTILIEQFKNEPAMQLNLEIMSWIGSINGLAGIPSILMPHLMQWKGRKIAFITTCILMMTGWLFVYSSTNIIMILVGESFHGLGSNSLLTISQLSVSEMMAPKHRNIALLTFGESQFLGLVLGAIMARFLHWKTIALIMCIPVVISMLMAFAWPESPSWLASKGKFERCEKAFIYLRGTEANEQNELYELITAQKINLSRDKIMVSQFSLKRFCQTITRKDFYKPIFHIIVLMFLMYWTGNMVIVIYCIEIIKKTTSNEISLYSSIIVNCIVLIGFTINNVLVRFYNNKTVMLVSTFFSALSLLVTSLISYLQYVDILAKDSLLCLLGLIIFMAASSLGLIPGVFTIAAEIMPVKHRGMGGAVYIICTCLLHGSSLKAALYLFLYLDLWGTLLIYTLNASLCGLILWKYLPETKDKSLQDIENYYMFGSYSLQECLEANNKLLGDK